MNFTSSNIRLITLLCVVGWVGLYWILRGLGLIAVIVLGTPVSPGQQLLLGAALLFTILATLICGWIIARQP